MVRTNKFLTLLVLLALLVSACQPIVALSQSKASFLEDDAIARVNDIMMFSEIHGADELLASLHSVIDSREDFGDLPGDTWGQCVLYDSYGDGGYLSFRGNISSFTDDQSTWDNRTSQVWVKKGFQTTLYDGTNYSSQLATFDGFNGRYCNNFGCLHDLTDSTANNRLSSVKCESALPGDTWGHCVLYDSYGDGNYLSFRGDLPSFTGDQSTWDNRTNQVWIKRGFTAMLYPNTGYQVNEANHQSAVRLSGYVGNWCNFYGCLHDLMDTQAEKTTSSVQCGKATPERIPVHKQAEGWSWYDTYMEDQIPDGPLVAGSLDTDYASGWRVAVLSKEDWEKLIFDRDGKPAPISTDFSRYFIVVLRAKFNTGGYSAGPISFFVDNYRLIVNVEAKSPGQGCRVIQSFSHPYWIFEVPRAYYNEGLPGMVELNIDYHDGPACSVE